MNDETAGQARRLGPRLPARLAELAAGLEEPTGTLYQGAETEAEARERRAAYAQRLHGQWMTCVPPEFAGARLADLPAALTRDLRAWWESSSPTLLVRGALGVGKTYIAYALGGHAAASGIPAQFTSVVRYAEDLRERDWGRLAAADSDTVRRRLAAMRELGFLILDDLGSEQFPKQLQAPLTTLLDERQTHSRRTVITTNCDIPTLTGLYGDRFASRLGAAVALDVTGPDRRLILEGP